jgi:hypothetical protein
LRVAATPTPDPNLHIATPPTADEPQPLAPTIQMPPTTTYPPLRVVDSPTPTKQVKSRLPVPSHYHRPQQHQTTAPLLVSLMTPSNRNGPKLSTCDFTGFAIACAEANSTSIGNAVA